MTIAGLDAALAGLRVAQQQLSVTSANIANVGTDGYTRKIMPQSVTVVASKAQGVQGDTIIRKVDVSLERDFWAQVSATNFASVKVEYLNQIQQFHGPPDQELSIAAKIAALRDDFSALSDSPDDGFLLRAALDQAVSIANKFNDFSDLLNQMRSDTQLELQASVNNINSLLERIADLNVQIKYNLVGGRTTAALEDLRDKTVKSLSAEIEVNFFMRSDGVMCIQTARGEQLADEQTRPIYFNPDPIGSNSFYPNSVSGIYLGGNPATNPTAVDLSRTGLGGKVGALLELRDETLPAQMAQIDELAHKLALRFEAQGLRLFTDAQGQVPLDTAPTPNPPGPLTPVTYVGFAGIIEVNQAVLDDSTLLRTGTVATDLPVQGGSNEVIRRIVEFAFGEVHYQEAAGSKNLLVSAGASTLQEELGLYSQNRIVGTANIPYDNINTLMAAGGDVFAPPLSPILDQFTITFEEPRLGLGPTTVTIDLTDAHANNPIGGAVTDALDQVIAEINAQITAAGVPAGLAASASRNQYGQLVINTRGNAVIDATFVGGMGQDGLDYLGLTEGTYTTTDPYFDVQVGSDTPVRITIEPGDTEVDLLAKLEWNSTTQTGVPGLYADIDPLTGFLTLRPGNDDSNNGPVFGGDIKLIGGPFSAQGALNALNGGNPTANGDAIIDALFGNIDPVEDVLYRTLDSSGNAFGFRESELGPGANISTSITGSRTLIDFSQKIINRQSELASLADAELEDEKTYQDVLGKQLTDQSGVNLDEELSNLIIIQTAYVAAARAITTIDEMTQELMNSI